MGPPTLKTQLLVITDWVPCLRYWPFSIQIIEIIYFCLYTMHCFFMVRVSTYFQKFWIFSSKSWKTSKIASEICKQKLQAKIASRNCKQKLQVSFEFKTSKTRFYKQPATRFEFSKKKEKFEKISKNHILSKKYLQKFRIFFLKILKNQ